MSEQNAAQDIAVQVIAGVVTLVVAHYGIKAVSKFVINPFVDRRIAKIEAREAAQAA